MKATKDMLQKTEGDTPNSRSTPSIIIGNLNEEAQPRGAVNISNASKSCAPLETGEFLDLEESSSRATNIDWAGNSQSTSSGEVSVNRTVQALDSMQRAVKRGAARKKTQHDNEDGSVAISQGMVDITDTADTSPGAVSVQGIGSSTHSDSALEDQQDQEDHRTRTDIEHGTEDPNGITPSLIVTARLVSENPLMPEFLEEHLERRIQDVVESRLRAQQPDYQHAEPPQAPIITTVVAEPIAPANATSPGSDKENPVNPSETSSRKVCGLHPLLLLVLVVMVVAGAVTGVFLAMNQPTQAGATQTTPPTQSIQTTEATEPTQTTPPTQTPNSQLLESLQPWIVRSDNDLAVFQDPGSPQARALDWLSLSLDSNNISDSGPTAIVLERYVVAVLYFSTNGPNWFMDENDFLLMATDVCTWNNDTTSSCGCYVRGIICGNQSTVERISLDQGLSGTIPWELSLLSDLSSLSLSGNTLVGTIPTELGKLTRLQSIYIYQSRLAGTLPSEFGQLAALTELWLTSIRLTGSIPSELGKLAALTYLDIELNSFTGTIPTELGQLNQLRNLYINDNMLNGTVPSELGLLTGLTHLPLNSNLLTGSIPSELGQLTALIFLDMESNSFAGTIPTELGQLNQLRYLYFSSNKLNRTVPTELGQLTGLSILWLSENLMTGTLPTELGRLTMLEEFYADVNGFTGTVPMSLSALSNLTHFWFFQNDLTGSVNNIFCADGKEWQMLESDCLATNGDVEIQCDCCTRCCNANGTDCQ